MAYNDTDNFSQKGSVICLLQSIIVAKLCQLWSAEPSINEEVREEEVVLTSLMFDVFYDLPQLREIASGNEYRMLQFCSQTS